MTDSEYEYLAHHRAKWERIQQLCDEHAPDHLLATELHELRRLEREHEKREAERPK
jgi:hypothetical protein